jgi:hypothetical protein
VQRIKSNHRYIKVGQQDRFQAMIDKLMQRTVIMSKEEFKSTIDMIQSEFPTTGTWLKWHFDNGRGPLIFRSLADDCISGYGYDTNGQEGIGGWIQRTYGLSKPTFKQALQHLVVFSTTVQEDYEDSVGGKQLRYGLKTSPDERADARQKKKRKLTEFFPSDGRPPDTSKDVPREQDTNVSAHFIPFGFVKQLTSLPHVTITAINTCSIDTVLMALFVIRKSYNEMLHYFIRESGKLNSTLNLIERGNFADARFLWMNHLANDPTIDATWMCRVTSKNGAPLWDCWSDEFVHFRTLRMMKFVEVNERGICDKCGSQSQSIQDTPIASGPLDTASENTSQNDDESRLEKLTILHYRRDEHARKLLESIRRDRTQEENDLVNRTLDFISDTPTRSEKAVSDGHDSVLYDGMHRLNPKCWLNDEVVNFFHKVCLNKHDITLCERNEGRKRSHAFNSFFMRELFGQELLDPNKRGIYNFAAVARWSKMVPGGNIFNLRYLLFPINISDVHWTLAVVSMEDRCIRYYDSLPDRTQFHTDMRNGIRQYLKDEYKKLTDGNELNETEWDSLDCSSETPRQINGEWAFDCCCCADCNSIAGNGNHASVH